jgi:PAS domain S-box-containing protein
MYQVTAGALALVIGLSMLVVRLSPATGWCLLLTGAAAVVTARASRPLVRRTAAVPPLICAAIALSPLGVAPTTAMAFVLLAAGQVILLTAPPQPWMVNASQMAAIASGAISVLDCYGVLFRRLPPLAFGPAAASLLLAVAVLAASSHIGIARLLFGSSTSCVFTRRLLGSALVALPVFGLLLIAGQDAGWYGIHARFAMLVAANVALVGAVTLVTGAQMDASQRELRQREEMAGILRHVPTAFTVKGFDGRYLLASAAFERLHGLPEGGALGLSDHELHSAEELAEIVRRDRAVLTRDRPMVFEDERADGDGTRTFVTSVFPMRGPDGRPVAICSATTEITEVRVAESKFRSMLAASPEAAICVNAEGRIVLANPQALQVFGYELHELLGTAVESLVPAAHRSRHIAHRRNYLANPVPRRMGEGMQLTAVRKDGTEFPAEISLTTVDGDNGPVVLASVQDITADVEAEQRLRLEREQFQMIMTAASDPFVSMDTHGRITEFNRQAEQISGWQREDVLGRRALDTILPARYAGAVGRLLDGRWDWLLDRPTEMNALCRDGTELPVELTLWRTHRDGAPTFHAFGRDVTARRQTEIALEQARDRAIEMTRLKSQFLASMSHEIRTPMNGVIGLGGLLLDTALDDTQRRYAEGIRNAGIGLLSVINDILDFSKLEAGKVLPERVDFDVCRLLDEVVALVADSWADKTLTVAARCDPRLYRPVSGDAGRLRQVLLNLVGNAIKFTERGRVEVTATALGDGPDGATPTRFVVTDTGIGIPEEKQRELFEPFTQADAGTTRRFGGTGLGLAISRELVAVMGGEISVSSRPGDGSAFSFTVPLWPADEAAVPPHPVLEGLRVLLVGADDEERRELLDQLRAWRMTPVIADDAEAAVRALAGATTSGRPFDIVLCDDADAGPITGFDGTAPARVVRMGGRGAVLPRPIRQSQLYDLLVSVIAAPGDRPPEETPISVERQGHVLLVEDNAINQTVAVGILARLGYSADVAPDGRVAVALAAENDYLAIFMDCLMPEMDGYTATAEIRRREAGDRHVPIIAMTAGALPEDRARCLAAGMDDHIAKPVMPQDITNALERCAAARPSRSSVRRQIEQRLDLLRAAAPTIGDEALADLLRRLIAQVPALVEESMQALALDDAQALRHAAHQLKGAAGNLGARGLAEAAGRLEQAARAGDLAAAVELVTDLRTVARETTEAVHAITVSANA